MIRLLLLAAVLPLAACTVSADGDDDGTPGIQGQGAGNTRTYAAAGFNRVTLRGADDVDIRVGPGFSVRADGDAEVLEHVKIEKVGDTLRIGRVRSAGWSWGGKGAKISVTMPSLAEAAVAGSGDMTIDRVQGAAFEGAGAGSGSLHIGQLAVDNAKLSMAGSGGMKLAGTAKRLEVAIAGSGNVEAGGLKAGEADVSIAGSGSVRADVSGPGKVSILGSGDVDLGSNAKCEVSKMGSGSVRCGG